MNRVLIADDHPIMLSGLEAVLRGTQYQVVGTARDGAAALEALAALGPEILVVDIQMPVQSGMDVLRVLRSRGDMIPVVLLTAELDDRHLLEALKLGVNGILLKDGAQTQLLTCLDSVRHGRRWIEKSLHDRAADLTASGAADSPDPLRNLTPKELALVRLVSRGLRNRNIAAELDITEGTVKVYLHRIYEKVGVTNRTELALLMQNKAG
jgi:two-component system nitrate/nitrite response regulator NarP